MIGVLKTAEDLFVVGGGDEDLFVFSNQEKFLSLELKFTIAFQNNIFDNKDEISLPTLNFELLLKIKC